MCHHYAYRTWDGVLLECDGNHFLFYGYFQERQRNKDSPYNFNNPPQTTLNLEEYEKTGRVPEKTSPKFLTATSESTSRELSTSASHIQDEVFSPIKDKPASEPVAAIAGQAMIPDIKPSVVS